MKQYELSKDEQWIIDTYRKVNAEGKEYLRNTVDCVEDYPQFQMNVLRIVRKEDGRKQC